MRGTVERNDELMDGIAQRMKDLRERKRISQRALAEKTGVGREIIANLEICRTHSVSLDTAIRLAKGLGVPLSALAPEVGTLADSALADAKHKLAAVRRALES